MNVSAPLVAYTQELVGRLESDDVGDIVDLLVLVAHADGVIDPDERAALVAGCGAIVGGKVAPQVVSVLVHESLEKIEAEGVGLRAVAIGAALNKAGRPALGLRIGAAVAFSSGDVSEVEHDLLVTVARAAGLRTAELDAILAEERRNLGLG